MNLNRARELRKNMTEAEQLLWKHLRAHRLAGYKFKRQQPIGVYIVDFVCFAGNCIVEADGGQHMEQAEYDAHRDAWLKTQGFTVLRFWNNVILTNTEGVLDTIAAVCRANTPSPQPLSHQGRGANTDVGNVETMSTGYLQQSKAPLSPATDKTNESKNSTQNKTPLSSCGRGAGGEGEEKS